jgi:hypothetical protein
MERIAHLIDIMIDMELVNQKNEIVSILDMDISKIFSNLKEKIQLLDDNLEFKVDLKKIVFKYRDMFVTVSYKRKNLNFGGDIYRYQIIIKDTD